MAWLGHVNHLKGHFTHVKLFLKITEIETLINITYIVRFFLLNKCFCVLLLIVLMTKLLLPWAQPYCRIYYVSLAGFDVSGVEDFVEDFLL